jgi:hypothetical protein
MASHPIDELQDFGKSLGIGGYLIQKNVFKTTLGGLIKLKKNQELNNVDSNEHLYE